MLLCLKILVVAEEGEQEGAQLVEENQLYSELRLLEDEEEEDQVILEEGVEVVAAEVQVVLQETEEAVVEVLEADNIKTSSSIARLWLKK